MTVPHRQRPILWIGMFEAEVTSRCRLFENATFAGANVVALAESADDFMSRVRSALEDLGLVCLEFEEVETYDARTNAFEVHGRVSEAARRALDSREVEFATFHYTDEPPEVDSR